MTFRRIDWIRLAVLAASLALAAPARAQTPALLARHYQAGDSIHYSMVATNQGRSGTLSYSVRADGVVRRDSLGRFYEALEWSHLERNGQAVQLASGGPAVQQRLTLAPAFMLSPDVAHTDPRLIGPVLDLLTFYVDLWLSAKMPLARTGDHARFPRSTPNSWADGRTIVLGEDAVDFEMTLVSVDSSAGRARLQVRHVPPAAAVVHFPASWLGVPLFDTPNNWVQVEKATDTTFIAGSGRETFDVEIDVALADGSILSATMDNPVDLQERVCRDAALADCGSPRSYRILRRIALRAFPGARP